MGYVIYEEHIEAILKHPSLRSLDLGIGISSQSLGCFQMRYVQYQLASLEHLNIATEGVQVSDIEAFFGANLTLPHIARFSLCFTLIFYSSMKFQKPQLLMSCIKPG